MAVRADGELAAAGAEPQESVLLCWAVPARQGDAGTQHPGDSLLKSRS